MNRQVQVLIIDNSPGVTGALKSILHLTSRLEGFTFHYAVPHNSPAVSLLQRSGKHATTLRFVELQRNWKVFIYFPMLLWNCLQLLKYIRTHKVDIVHVNDLYNMTGILIKIARPTMPLVYHVRLLNTSYARQMYSTWVRLIYKFADRIIAVSNNVARGLPPEKKLQRIYNGIPVPVDQGHHSDRRSFTNKPFTFLYVGNYIEGKGQDYAIEAFARIVAQVKSVLLVFAGGDLGKDTNKRFGDKLQARVVELGLSSKVLFNGFTSDVTELYRSCDAVLNFSVSESFSMVCLEALMHGVPVISSRSGGPEEIIEDGINGLLVENRNVDAMATAMLRLAAEPDFLDQLRKATHRVRNRFSIERSADELRDVYEKLLAGAGR